MQLHVYYYIAHLGYSYHGTIMIGDRQRILEEAKKNIIEAQAKQKEQYDRKHAQPEYYQVDQQVLKKYFTRKKTRGGKLKERYLGPYTITKVLPHGVYEIRDEVGLTIRVTGAHLKVYKMPATDTSIHMMTNQGTCMYMYLAKLHFSIHPCARICGHIIISFFIDAPSLLSPPLCHEDSVFGMAIRNVIVCHIHRCV